MARIVDTFEQLTPHEQKNLVAALKELLQASIDGRAGYGEAARDVRDAGLRYLFEELAKQRGGFAEQLQVVVERLNARVDGSGDAVRESAAGELHRLWTHVRAAIERHEPTAIIAECERGEHHAVTKWEHALAIALPIDVQSMLLDQVEEIRKTRESLERMRHPW